MNSSDLKSQTSDSWEKGLVLTGWVKKSGKRKVSAKDACCGREAAERSRPFWVDWAGGAPSERPSPPPLLSSAGTGLSHTKAHLCPLTEEPAAGWGQKGRQLPQPKFTGKRTKKHRAGSQGGNFLLVSISFGFSPPAALNLAKYFLLRRVTLSHICYK